MYSNNQAKAQMCSDSPGLQMKYGAQIGGFVGGQEPQLADVDCALSSQAASIDVLKDVVSSLIERLSPVLAPVDGDTKEEVESGSACELSSKIRENTLRIKRLSQFLSSSLRALQI